MNAPLHATGKNGPRHICLNDHIILEETSGRSAGISSAPRARSTIRDSRHRVQRRSATALRCIADPPPPPGTADENRVSAYAVTVGATHQHTHAAWARCALPSRPAVVLWFVEDHQAGQMPARVRRAHSSRPLKNTPLVLLISHLHRRRVAPGTMAARVTDSRSASGSTDTGSHIWNLCRAAMSHVHQLTSRSCIRHRLHACTRSSPGYCAARAGLHELHR